MQPPMKRMRTADCEDRPPRGGGHGYGAYYYLGGRDHDLGIYRGDGAAWAPDHQPTHHGNHHSGNHGNNSAR